MNRSKAIIFVALSAVSLLSGCGTFWNMEFSKERDTGERAIYGGVQIDAHLAFDSTKDALADSNSDHATIGSAIAMCMLAILDAPLSAIADTLTLPITISATLKKMRETDATGSSSTTITPERVHGGIQ